MIIFVAVFGQNREMGLDNHLPWPWHSMSADLKRYKSLMKNQIVVMGARTYSEYKNVQKSVGTDKVIVITRDQETLPDAEAVSDINEIAERSKSQNLVVVGGASIFKQLLPYADKLYLTIIHHTFKADTFFPDYQEDEWQEIYRQDFPADAKNPYPYTFLELNRNK